MTIFATLSPALQQAVASAGYAEPTPVQQQSLPDILAGHDLIALAPTGSGKTAAFGLGLLQRLQIERIATQALVLCPTRELADQVAKALRKLAAQMANVKISVYTGGVAIGPQQASLAHPAHIVVGTPGRLQELIDLGALKLDAVGMLVLDEADRMLDMGFGEAILAVIARLPKNRQSLMFSATWPDEVGAVAASCLRDPRRIDCRNEQSKPQIEHYFIEATEAQKLSALAAWLCERASSSAVVFCNTRKRVDEVAGELQSLGFAAAALHGDMEQRDRDETLVCFGQRSLSVLVASDVAARGLDVKELPCVINFDVPGDADSYLHRVGRTARAGETGLALSLVAPSDAQRTLGIIERHQIKPRWLKAGRPTQPIPRAAMRSLRIDAGRTEKLRPGDILGALTGEAGLPATAIGKIDVFATRCYVAIGEREADRAFKAMQAGKIKGKKRRVAWVR